MEPQLSALHQHGGVSQRRFQAAAEPDPEFGVRYEVDMIPADRYDHLTNFVPEIGKVVLVFDDPSVKDVIASAGLQDRVTFAGAAGLPRSLVNPDYNNIAPRVGFAW